MRRDRRLADMDLSGIIKAYDVRGIVPDEFDEDIARRMASGIKNS